jgi:hypothetical protein
LPSLQIGEAGGTRQEEKNMDRLAQRVLDGVLDKHGIVAVLDRMAEWCDA